MENNENIIIFGLGAGEALTQKVCKELNIQAKRIKKTRFADGEILMESLDSVRGKEIYVIQSTSTPVNENLMELLIAVDAFKRSSAEKINVVIPYYGYARQDRKAKGRQPITAKLVADLLKVAGANRVITIDIHSAQAMGFFDIPMDNFHTSQILAEEIIETIVKKNFDVNRCILVSPDYGGLTRVHGVGSFTSTITNGIAVIAKRRPAPNQAEVEFVLGDIEGKNCFIIDDMIDTGGTILNAAKCLKDKGAKSVYIFACHGLFNNGANQRLAEAIKNKIIEKVVVTDTIDIPEHLRFEGLEIITVASLLADMIKASTVHGSLSEVYSTRKQKIRDKAIKYLEKV